MSLVHFVCRHFIVIETITFLYSLQRICTNVRDRKIEQKRASENGDLDAVDSSMIWFIIRQLRQRQRDRGEGGSASHGESSSTRRNNTLHPEFVNFCFLQMTRNSPLGLSSCSPLFFRRR